MALLEGFLAKWAGSEGSEKANAQLFFTELCDVLELPHPAPATKSFFERATAVRDLVEALPAGSTFDAAAFDVRFKRKSKTRRAEIESILDTFAALGQLIPLGSARGHAYARPERLTG